MNRVAVLSIAIVLFVFIIFPSYVFGESSLLREGIEQHKQENYEEAIDLLKKARKEDPKSSSAAFLKGLVLQKEGRNLEAFTIINEMFTPQVLSTGFDRL